MAHFTTRMNSGPVGAKGRLNFSFPYSTSWTKGFRPLEQKDATSLTLKTSPRWPTICRQVISRQPWAGMASTAAGSLLILISIPSRMATLSGASFSWKSWRKLLSGTKDPVVNQAAPPSAELSWPNDERSISRFSTVGKHRSLPGGVVSLYELEKFERDPAKTTRFGLNRSARFLIANVSHSPHNLAILLALELSSLRSRKVWMSLAFPPTRR